MSLPTNNLHIPAKHRGAWITLDQHRGTMCYCCDLGGDDCGECKRIWGGNHLVAHGISPVVLMGQETSRNEGLAVLLDYINEQWYDDDPRTPASYGSPGQMQAAVSALHALVDLLPGEVDTHQVRAIRSACTRYGTCSHSPEALRQLQKEEDVRDAAALARFRAAQAAKQAAIPAAWEERRAAHEEEEQRQNYAMRVLRR